MQIAAVERSRKPRPEDFAFRVLAVCETMLRDFGPAWRGKLRGADQEPWPVVDYKSLQGIRPSYLHPIFEMDTIGDPDAAGFHDDAAGFIYGRVLVPGAIDDATTLDHEAKEMRLDPTCDLWSPMPDGREIALEACDPVEGDSFAVEVEFNGHRRKIMCSNFVLPAYFEAGSAGPWDHLGLLGGPFEMTPGGYQIIRDPKTGDVENVFAASADTPHGHAARKLLSLKRADPHTRLARRLANAARSAP